MTWTAHEVDDQPASERYDEMIAVCPYCGKEHPTDVVNVAGECPTVACCGEMHCYEKGGPLDPDVMKLPCPRCADGNVWTRDGPTGAACPACKGHGFIIPRGKR
jgi:hypothetical protein